MSENEPLAVVNGEEYSSPPASLYIPPEAMRVFLESFSGPMDLLLHLVRRDRIDIRNIPVAELTKQYISYVEEMVSLQMDLAAEYLMMSAILIEIKSRMLLPHKETEDVEEEDPRAELVRRLVAYERIRKAAVEIGMMPRAGNAFLVAHIAPPSNIRMKPQLDVESLKMALAAAMDRKEAAVEITMERERLSLREAMSLVMNRLSEKGRHTFQALFAASPARPEHVGVVLMAVLELANERLVHISQKSWDDPIALRLSKRN